MHESTTTVMPRRGPVSPVGGQADPDPQAVAAVLAISARAGARGAGFTGFGYLTEVAGVHRSEVFVFDTVGLAEVAGSLFTVYLDGSVVQAGSGAILGELTVFQRARPGAAFRDPSSFTDGHVVAAYDLTLHGAFVHRGPAVGGLLLQTHAGRLAAGLRGRRFGRRGARLQVAVSDLDGVRHSAGQGSDPAVGAVVDTVIDPLARNTQWMLASALDAAA